MRAPSCFSRCLVTLCVLSASAFALEVGDDWDAPPPELGKPLGKLAVGEKTLYRWPELEVTVAGGRITQIRRLDSASVAADVNERAKANAAERARLLVERKERAKAEAIAQKAAALAEREAKLVAARAAEAEADRRTAETLADKARAEETARRRAEAEARIREAELAAREAREKAEREERAAAIRAREAADAKERRLAQVRSEAEQKAAAAAAKEAETRAKREAEARDHEREKIAAAERAARKANTKTSPSASGAGVALVKPVSDPTAKLEREILFLELDLKRAESGSEASDRARAAQLRAILKNRRAQLEALKEPR